MNNSLTKTSENSVQNLEAKAVNSIMDSAQKLRTGASATAEAAMDAVKSEVSHISKVTQNAASKVAAEVVKRPLTYTLAAAGAGALFGLGLMAVINRPRSNNAR